MAYRDTPEALGHYVEPSPLGVTADQADLVLASCQLSGKTYDEVYRLWKTPGAITKPAVRQRAVSMLTTFSGNELPFDNPDQPVQRIFYIDESIDQEQRPRLRSRIADRPDLSHELAQGALYWLESMGDKIQSRHNADAAYQELILELLPLVDRENGDKLFSFFKINDLTSYDSYEINSGYRPLEALITDKAIPLKYRASGLTEWCSIAANEELDAAQPRRPHERATAKMSEILQLATYSLENDTQTFDEIIRVIEDKLPAGIAYVTDIVPGSIGIASVADAIGDVELRNCFLQRHGRPANLGATALSDIQVSPSAVGEMCAAPSEAASLSVEERASALSLNVQSQYFKALKDGRKTIEGRLAKSKYSDLRPGDRITITDDSSGEQLVMEVESLHIYAAFDAAFAKREDFRNAIPDAATADEAAGVYEQFYPPAEQADYGVVFVEVKQVRH